MNPQEVILLSAICRKYGDRVDGGHELFIPNELLGQIPVTSQIHFSHPDQKGIHLRYVPTRVIEGVKVEKETPPVEPPLISEPVVENSPPHTLDEYA